MSMSAKKHEAERLEALYQYQILDTDPETAFDDIALLASQICETPIALITLVDEARQWFKANIGLAATETPRDVAFCNHAIRQTDMMIVPDALADPRFATNPLVTADPHIRFYAGSPLITPNGAGLGTLCVIDRVSRELTAQQIIALEALARQVGSQLELRRAAMLLEEANHKQAKLIDELEAALAKVETLEGIIPICMHCKNIREDGGFWERVEDYISHHSQAVFSHGICPDCMQKLYPEAYQASQE